MITFTIWLLKTARGDAWVAGTWTQVPLGAGIAGIMKDDLDGALAEISPALTLAPEFRMATITGYTSQIDRRLQQRRFLHSDTATEISARVRNFQSHGTRHTRVMTGA